MSNLNETKEIQERVLVIDDDRAMCELIADYLSEENFKVDIMTSSPEGLKCALEGNHSVVVLDVMMPRLNGIEVLRRLRAESEIPVLMLTARGSDIDRIVGLEVGADDYLPKPFNPRELVARLRAILRRTKLNTNQIAMIGNGAAPRIIQLGDLTLDTGTRLVKCNDRIVDLTVVEYEMLLMLLESAGKIVSREALVRAVLGRDLSPFDRSVDTHISHIRKKLGHFVGDGERIKTIRGVGYIYALTG